MGASTATIMSDGQSEATAEIIRKDNCSRRRVESGALLTTAAYCALLTYALVCSNQGMGLVTTSAGLCGAFVSGAFARFMTND